MSTTEDKIKEIEAEVRFGGAMVPRRV